MSIDLQIYDLMDPEGVEMKPQYVSAEEIKGLYDAMVEYRCEDIPLNEDTKRCSQLNERDPKCGYDFWVRGEVKRVCLCHLQFNQSIK